MLKKHKVEKHTIDGLALREVAIILASQETVAISPDNPLNVAGKHRKHGVL